MKTLKLFGLLTAAVMGIMFTACSDDDDDKGGQSYVPKNAVIVLGSGNQSSGVSGDISIYDNTNATVLNNVFSTANNRELGMTPNDIVINTDNHATAYIMCTQSNTVEIVNVPSLTSVKQIALAGNDTYGQPRRAVYADGSVYVSMFTGHVVRINATTNEVDGVVAFSPLEGSQGTYPEGLAVVDGKIYVALSGYSDGVENRVAVVDAKSMAIDKYITVTSNLTDIVCAAGNIYALSAGWYDMADGWKQKDAGLYTISDAKKVCDATLVAATADGVYYINNPYGEATTTLGYYDAKASTCTTLAQPAPGFSDNALGVSLDGSYLLIGSNNKGESGYPSYSTPGYMVKYSIADRKETEVQLGAIGIKKFLFY